MVQSFLRYGERGAGGTYFYHPDHLGSSSLITNGSGDLVQHIQYVPFGEVFVEERNATWSTPYKFNGKELDEETGLAYYHARYYDPRTSVWLSVDPLVEEDGFFSGEIANGGIYNSKNLSYYAYCYNNPVVLGDPTGKWPTPDTFWDGFNIGLGVVSFVANCSVGNVGGAALDLAGIIVDGVAIAVPIVPGGAGTAIKSYRLANTAHNVYTLYTGSKLARNMYKAFQASKQTRFMVVQGLMEAHHIIPQTAKVADKARKIMGKFGIDVDDAINGVALPKQFHRSVAHTKEYYKRLEDAVGTWKSADDVKYFLKTEADYLIKEAAEMAK